jgi:ABC-type nitrate/sulfonate/bicarbonate transport system substrate-binding protein
MNILRCAAPVVGLLLIAACWSPAVHAQEKLKIAVGMHGNWEDAAPELGTRAGIFQKHGMQLEMLYTGGAGGALQAVISGSVDIGVGVGTAGVMAAFLRGAPLRIIGSATTGTNDIFWYVKSDSPIRSLKDARPSTTIAYSSAGAATNFFVTGLLKTYNIEARPTATGDMQATLTQVMTGQVDIGFAAPPMGLKQVEEGAIRIVGRASDIPWTRDQTVRAIIVNENKLAKAPQLIGKFVQAYAETVDWMYSDPAALKEYERYSGTPERLTRRVMTEFYSKEMLDPYRMSGLPALMDDAVAFKFLKERLNDAQLKELIQVPQRPRMN